MAKAQQAARPRRRGRAIVHYVQGTHWDREWYLPFQHYRARLVWVLDRLLDIMERRADFQTFFLDGQTSLVEDYLAIRPARRERLYALIRAGRIQVGPWFTMPDEFLVSGEAIVRNLLLGHRLAAEMGARAMPVGYVCDMFGQASQLPQILRGFDIDNALFFRGVNDETGPARFRWASPDGSQVLAVKLPDTGGYGVCTVKVRQRCQVAGDPVGSDADVQAMLDLAEAERARTASDVVLFLDALDHFPPEERMADVLAAANERAGARRFLWSTLENFIAAVRPAMKSLPLRTGELREPAVTDGPILNNVLSSRIPLKQANARCQTLLEAWAEPLGLLAQPAGYDGGRPYIDLAWKYLLLNHAHDSICGCSLDQVHQDMAYRFDQSRMLAEVVRCQAADAVAARTKVAREPGQAVFQVWNPLPVCRDEVVDLRLLLPDRRDETAARRAGERGRNFELLDESGRRLPCQVLAARRITPNVYMRHDGYPQFEGRFPVEVAVRLALPACGYRTLTARYLDRRENFGGTLSPAPGVMENESLRVEIQPNGAFDLTDKRNRSVYRGLGLLEDMADIGDGWNHIRPLNDEVITTLASSASVARIADGPYAVTCRITHRLALPVCFDEAAECRSPRTREVAIATDLTLRRGATALECRTEVMNVVRDHSLRLLLPTDLAVDDVLAETPYDVVRRPVRLRPPERGTERDQEVKPVAGFFGVHDGRRGLVVTTEGIHEAGLRDDPRRTLVMTICRAFPRNWDRNLLDQTGGQVQGRLDLRWQIIPIAGPWDASAVAMRARAMTAGIYVHLVQQSSPQPDLPPSQSLMELETGRLTVTALKPAEARDSAILRVVNLNRRAACDRARFARKVLRYRPCTLAEKPAGKWHRPVNGWLLLAARPGQVVGYEIEWA